MGNKLVPAIIDDHSVNDDDDDNDFIIKNQELKIRLLQDRVLELEDALRVLAHENKPKSWDHKIDNYIDDWFDKNKDAVDIGVIQIMGKMKVDILPDELEKHIYKKTLKILFSLITTPCD
tara:strand:- start:1586 stop:1945 length:360 start_codon:yes stop_codon:yes gene_type:complete